MSLLDVFQSGGGAFSVRALTASVNNMPFVPGAIGSLGIFNARGMDTDVAMVEVRNQRLYLVPAAERGAPPKKNRAEGRITIPLKAQHLPVEDVLQADAVLNKRQFGSENTLETVQFKINEKFGTMFRSLDATVEHHRVGAVCGKVLDADGTKVLLDVFDAFGVSQHSEIDFDLDNASAGEGAVRKKCSEVIRKIEDELGGTPIGGVHAICDEAFFDDLIDHPECVKRYERWNDGQALRDQGARRTFWYAGIMFEEYRGKVGNVKFVPTGKAQFFPVGVPDLFDELYAPANHIEAVGSIGLPRYAMVTPDRKGRWVELDAQTNPLIYCNRPRTLIRGKRT